MTSEDVTHLDEPRPESLDAADAVPERLIEPLVVRRSTIRTWVASLLAVPMIVIGVDVLWRQRIVAWLTARIFPDEPQLLEARDEIWATAMVVIGGAVVLWGLKELFFPAPMLRTDDSGVHVRMMGPWRPATLLPWTTLHDIDAGTLEDDGDPIEVLIIEVKDEALLPENPWAARRFDRHTVALFSTEWEMRADVVAVRVAEQAVVVARHSPPSP